MGTYVIVAHHQHVRQLLQLGFADTPSQCLRRIHHIHPNASPPQHIGHYVRIRIVIIANTQYTYLYRSQPGGEGPRIVLQQNTKEPLDGAEQCPMQHHRPLAGVVGRHVFEIETLRHVEVVLDGGQLPLTTDGIAHIDVDLGTVKCGVALLDLVGNALTLHRFAQIAGGGLPALVGAYGLVRITGGQVGLKVMKTESAQ